MSRYSSSDSDDGASPESRALRRHYGSLLKAMATADLIQFSGTLYARHIINKSVMEEVNQSMLTKTKMNSVLVLAIMSSVEAKPRLFHKFIYLGGRK